MSWFRGCRLIDGELINWNLNFVEWNWGSVWFQMSTHVTGNHISSGSCIRTMTTPEELGQYYLRISPNQLITEMQEGPL